jgi:hypothetical protein
MLPPSSEWNQSQALNTYFTVLLTRFLKAPMFLSAIPYHFSKLSLLFYLEDGSRIFLRNVDKYCHFLVTKHWVWLDSSVYWNLIIRNYK